MLWITSIIWLALPESIMSESRCDFDGGGGIDGVFDASEVMNITIELVRRGYSEKDIEKFGAKM